MSTNHPDIHLYHADCREALKVLPDNCIDSVVTDPPYALQSIVKRFANSPRSAATENIDNPFGRTGRGFMGMRWDTGETAFDWAFWTEVLRVLKPGGHVAAFGASRGYHRMACAIEDAGFEIRDSLMWVYGTGFPKSHDVSKGIDKAAGAEREAVGEKRAGLARKARAGGDIVGCKSFEELRRADITVPATDAAREWEGWGTALKPAFEPIVLARKPLSEKTVAANVLRWRTGALNIDACRVDSKPRKTGTKASGDEATGTGSTLRGSSLTRQQEYDLKDAGRWPANVVLTFPEETYTIRADVDCQQRAELETWLAENAEH